jgi:hypothetical protein
MPKISELAADTGGVDADAVIPIVEGGVTKKATREEVVETAAHFPILTISDENTTLGSAHYGKYCVFTHATPNLTLNNGLTAGKVILGHATQGVLTFVDGTATVRKSALWGLTTTGAYAPFAIKVLAADEVHLSGELIDA